MKKGSTHKKSSGKKDFSNEEVVQVETVIINETEDLSEVKQKILTQFLSETSKIR